MNVVNGCEWFDENPQLWKVDKHLVLRVMSQKDLFVLETLERCLSSFNVRNDVSCWYLRICNDFWHFRLAGTQPNLICAKCNPCLDTSWSEHAMEIHANCIRCMWGWAGWEWCCEMQNSFWFYTCMHVANKFLQWLAKCNLRFTAKVGGLKAHVKRDGIGSWPTMHQCEISADGCIVLHIATVNAGQRMALQTQASMCAGRPSLQVFTINVTGVPTMQTVQWTSKGPFDLQTCNITFFTWQSMCLFSYDRQSVPFHMRDNVSLFLWQTMSFVFVLWQTMFPFSYDRQCVPFPDRQCFPFPMTDNVSLFLWQTMSFDFVLWQTMCPFSYDRQCVPFPMIDNLSLFLWQTMSFVFVFWQTICSFSYDR